MGGSVTVHINNSKKNTFSVNVLFKATQKPKVGTYQYEKHVEHNFKNPLLFQQSKITL